MIATAEAPVTRPTRPTARPVRVCFVIDNLSRAGTETQLLALLRALDRSRVEPSLVLLDGSSAESRSLEPTDLPVIRLGVRKLFGPTAIRAALRLRTFWKARRPDVVQAYFLDAAYFAAPLAKWCGVPAVVRVRNNLGYWLTRKHRLLGRLIAPLVSVTLTNSDAGRDALVVAGTPADRVAVLGNGVDTDRFAGFPPPFASDRVRIGCVANLRLVKNIDGLMRAAARVLDLFPYAVFEVAGDGEQRSALEKLHAELNLGNRFILRGSVSDIPGFLGSVDIAVLASHSEGMSNALLESMAAGRAVVATDVGANRAVLGGCGVIVPTDDAALADGIAGLLADPARAAILGAAASARAEQGFGRDAMRRRFEDFYTRLAAD